MVLTEEKINTGMIVLARESRGYSQKEMADLLGLSPGKLCKVELGEQNLGTEHLTKLETLLGYPHTFFYQEVESYLPSNLSFRKREKVAQKLIFPIEAQINISRIHAESLFKCLEKTNSEIPTLDIIKLGSAQEAAKKLRKIWEIPAGAIKNMTQILEEKEIPVLNFDFGTERVDSRLILTKEKHPLVFLNKTLLGDRLRFSLAYELGHLVMHAYLNTDFDRDTNHEANLFAAEFLMPEKDIRPDFNGDITVAKLAELKRKWKVSMVALLYRAADLECISYNQKNYLLSQFNNLQIRRREPVELDVPIEKAILMRDLITKYRKAQKLTLKETAASLHLTEEEFMRIYA